MSDDEQGAVDSRGAAIYLWGSDDQRNLGRLDGWAFAKKGPRYWKSSNARSAKRYYPREELRKFKDAMMRGTPPESQ